MLAEERRDALLELLKREDVGQLSQLADTLGVSTSTVRRDLDKLEALGSVRRVRGGALYVEPRDADPPWDSRWREHAQEKRTIGAAAARLVREGEMVFLDAGSSCVYLAEQLRGTKGITVVTNSLPVMWALSDDSGVNLVAIGGEFNFPEKYFYSLRFEQELAQMHLDKYFMGILSIDADAGLSESHMAEIAMKRTLMQASRQRIVLADGAKVGQASNFRLCPIADIDVLVTDAGADVDKLEQLEQAGVRVIVAR
jgi:DeoR/GlpR family transcriptional regulator of sugar metabolism